MISGLQDHVDAAGPLEQAFNVRFKVILDDFPERQAKPVVDVRKIVQRAHMNLAQPT